MPNFIDLTGKRFGRLVVLHRVENKKYKSGQTHITYLCKCDCGNTKEVLASVLRRGDSKSCGCLSRDIVKNRMITHGKTGSKLHNLWRCMKQRCYNKNKDNYKWYGGRGISICDEWLNNFMSFYDWAINNGYKDGLKIDRIDVNKNYCPENCRFITQKEQCRNTRKNKYITYKGIKKCYSEWEEILQIPKGYISHTLNK